MSEDIDAPVESDRVPGAPHPRETRRLVGQDGAVAAFAGAAAAGRLHHGWLITGPRGTGKATLAWRIARFLLAQPAAGGMFAPEPPRSLDTDPDSPLAHRIRAGAEPGIFVLKRGPNATESALSATSGCASSISKIRSVAVSARESQSVMRVMKSRR